RSRGTGEPAGSGGTTCAAGTGEPAGRGRATCAAGLGAAAGRGGAGAIDRSAGTGESSGTGEPAGDGSSGARAAWTRESACRGRTRRADGRGRGCRGGTCDWSFGTGSVAGGGLGGAGASDWSFGTGESTAAG